MTIQKTFAALNCAKRNKRNVSRSTPWIRNFGGKTKTFRSRIVRNLLESTDNLVIQQIRWIYFEQYLASIPTYIYIVANRPAGNFANRPLQAGIELSNNNNNNSILYSDPYFYNIALINHSKIFADSIL